MNRLIYADALKTALYYDVSKGAYGEFMDGSEVSLTDREILQLIDEQPTVDAVPVSELKDTEKERDYWMDMAHSYEQTILRLTISASDTTAEPVRHGKWIDETFKPWGLVHHPFKCNLCGDHAEDASPYCPNCGARMDVE